MIDLDQYIERIARIAGEYVDLTDYAAKVLGDRYGNGDQTVIECVDFRRTMLTVGDRDTLNWQRQLGFFPVALPADVQLGGYAFAAEVASAVLKLRMRTACAPYRRADPLFSGSPALWSSVRDGELIDFTALAQELGSEVVAVPKGFGKIAEELDPALVEWLRRNNPTSPFFVRLAPDRFDGQKPPMMLTEAVIAPGRFDALMKFDMYPGQREYGEYVLQKDALDPKNPAPFIDYEVERLRRLEIRAQRRGDIVSMMIEELPAPDAPDGLMVGRCIHLDTHAPNKTAIRDVKLSHLDLALNVYEGAVRSERFGTNLKDGKVTDASFRTHLMRIEGIPLLTLLPICAGFLRSKSLLGEWLKDLQQPK
ncbi:hypothetical protein BF49_3729 [Bradyrhizobium sp.]|uniref:hypothetical protein n=1 Tax=Bradyrhizobium sp. TaxID=376 RepID=UPI0007C1AF56|nr:hypothetical protein [Bradyrhizobium sp.]CUT12649.1 hypothetical protein BF49_3729 [Bradyrhizobium sp.]